MAKKNSLDYTVKVYVPRTIRVINGDIISLDTKNLTLRYKKPRSSKFAQRTFALADVVAYSGSVGKATQAFVFDRVLVATFKGPCEAEGDFLKITLEDGSIMRVRASDAEAIAEEVEAPPDDILKKKKKKSSDKEKSGPKRK